MDETELKLEIGDCYWFLSELCDVFGFSSDDVAMANIAKLRTRYPDKFEVERSVNRPEYREKQKGPRSKYYSSGGARE